MQECPWQSQDELRGNLETLAVGTALMDASSFGGPSLLPEQLDEEDMVCFIN